MCHCLLVRGNLTGPIIFPFFFFNLPFFFFLTHKGDNYYIFLLLYVFCFLALCSPGSRSLMDFKIKLENYLTWYYYLNTWGLLSCTRHSKCV